MRLIAIGAGAIGSYALEFLASRYKALDIQLSATIVDFDKIDDRNFANQFFSPEDQGKPKAEVMAKRMAQYDIEAEAKVDKLEKKNLLDLVAGHDLILDMVDNVAARELCWLASIRENIPCIHSSVSKAGHGKVVWSAPNHDLFNIGIKAKLNGNTKQDLSQMQDVKDPPCKLIEFAGLCINTAMATSKATTIFDGKDPEAYFGGEQEPPKGTMVSFISLRDQHMVDEKKGIKVHGVEHEEQEEQEEPEVAEASQE